MIYFFNMNIEIQRNLSNILGFEKKTLPTKYLRVPLTDKEGKITTWEGIIILTKVILQVILAYLLSVFPSPKGILQKK